jgi:rRNA maturation RNase YbeY
MTELVLRNRQRTRPVNSPLLRRITSIILRDLLSLDHYDLAIYLVAAPEMARLNQRFLDHAGSTDVITFNYTGEAILTPSWPLSTPERKLAPSGESGGAAIAPSTASAGRRASRSPREPLPVGAKGTPTQPPRRLHGEIFICIDDAVKQARQFRTSWQYELIRYLIHGMLHLVGYDDLTPAGRSVMKHEENRLLRLLSRQFSLSHLANAGSAPARKSQMVNQAASVSLSKRTRVTRVRS